MLIARKEYFAHELSRMEKDVNGFSTNGHTSSTSINNYCTRLATLKVTLEEAMEEARTIIGKISFFEKTKNPKKQKINNFFFFFFYLTLFIF